ncbi:MAG: F0F1 ATP synthase subunit alpha, partial [Candidatus Accumulibacter sp.]|nr:F0F1 ATP synthase subunit alpha [Accumulibacter sp.]
FASDLDEATRKQLDRGRLVTELMKQPQYSPMPISAMAVTLLAVNKGLFDDVDVHKALAVEKQMQGFIEQKHADLINKIETTKDLDADAEQQLTKAIEEFKATLA